MARIDQVRSKIERAKKHVADFAREHTAFFDTNRHTVSPEYYVEQDMTICFLEECAPIPEELPLIAGDAIHNLRSSLDYLIHQLILAAGNKPERKHQPGFPIFPSLKQYEAQSGGKIKGIDPKAADVIRASNPYQGGNEILWALHDLNNIDKHQLLLTAVSAVSKVGIEIGGRRLEQMFPRHLRFYRGRLPDQFVWLPVAGRRDFLGAQKGDPVFSIKGNFEGDKNIQLAFNVAFMEPEIVKGKPVLEFLFTATKVVDSLVSQFVPFLL